MEHSSTPTPPNLSRRFGVPLGFLLFFSCIWLTVVTLATTLMVRGMWNQYDARSRFVALPATLLKSEIKEHDGEDGTTYSNDVTYSYTYQGQEFSSDRIAFDSVSGSYQGAKRWQRDYPAGSSITAYVDPAMPQTAVLRTATGRMTWMMMLFLLPFQAVALGCVAALGAAVRDRLSPPHTRHALHGLIVRDDPEVTTFRLETVSALSGGIATTGVLAFISIFVVAFTTGMSPPPEVAIGVAAACVGLGVIVGFWRAWRVYRGLLDVTIDRRGGVLLLPPTAKAAEVDVSRPVPLKSIVQVRVRNTLPKMAVSQGSGEGQGGDGESSSPGIYTLEVLAGRTPNVATIVLHSTLPRGEAERISRYLREQCGLPEGRPEGVPEDKTGGFEGEGRAELPEAA